MTCSDKVLSGYSVTLLVLIIAGIIITFGLYTGLTGAKRFSQKMDFSCS